METVHNICRKSEERIQMSEYDLDLAEEPEERPFNIQYFLRILSYLRPYRGKAVWAAFLTLVGIVIGLVEPLLFREAIDRGITARDYKYLAVVLWVLMGLRVLQLLSSRAQINVTNYLGQKILYDLREGLFEHIQKLPFSFFDRRPVGKVVSRVTNDVNHIGNLAASGVINLVSQMVSLVGIIGIMLFLDYRMALLSFVTLPLIVLLLTKLRWALEEAWEDTKKAVASINAHLNETVQGLQVIQAFSSQKREKEKFSGFNMSYLKAYMRAVKIEQSLWPLSDVVGAFGTTLVIWYGSRRILEGTLTLGVIMAFVNYLGKFWGPISTFSRVWSQILSAMASAERVFSIMDLEPEWDVPEKQASLTRLPPISGDVVFENVSFSYKPPQKVLDNISFSVKAGETVALVGPTGAGKTTIINLLAGFYKPTGGRILVDGYDLSQVYLPSYRSQLGIVLQDTFIFSGTVMENLKFGNPEATVDQVVEAAASAQALDFIMKLPGGFSFEIKERGTNLSAGQRQLLAFARALLADPRILILDEATSSIDPETERLIQQGIKNLLKGRTSFIIAHRLSTVRNADKIMVVQDGKIVESGTHDELCRLNGSYAALYNAQFFRSDGKG